MTMRITFTILIAALFVLASLHVDAAERSDGRTILGDEARLEAFIRRAALEPPQRETLLNAWRQATASVVLLDETTALEISKASDQSYAAFAKVWSQWQLKRVAAFDDFEQKAQAILTEHQRPAWKEYMQRVRCERGKLYFAELTLNEPQPLDVDALLSECDITPERFPAVTETLAAYRDELERCFDALERQVPHGLLKRIQPENDAEKEAAGREYFQLIEASRKPAELFTIQIAEKLEGEARRCFLDKIACVQRPALCQPTPMDAAIQALRGCRSVRPEQLAAAEEIYSDYSSRFVLRRQRFWEAVRKWEQPEVAAKRKAWFQQLRDQKLNTDPAWEGHPGLPHLEAMHKLQWETRDRLRALFDETQLAEFPPSVKYVLGCYEDNRRRK